MSDDAPQPDRIDGARHPRDTPQLFGQSAAEAAFLDAFNSGKLHHGWLLTGPRGVGKAAARPTSAPATRRRIAHWIALALIPSGLMLATSTYITTDIK